jgi:phosphoglycerate kinase
MRRIADYDVRGKKVLVRADLNCPVKDGVLSGDTRIRAHAETIRNLSDRGARVIVLSHQGRKGRDDFLGLEQHAKALHHAIGRDVIYVDDVIGGRARKAIESLQDGQVLVLDNVRHLHCETTHPHGEGEIIYHLAPLADFFVLDALSVAHRKHSSVVGFARHMPCFAGEVLAAELDAVDKVRHASGHHVGDSMEYLKESGLLGKIPEAKELLERFDGKIVLPVDVGLSIGMERHEADASQIQKGQIWDIGSKTIERYKHVINNSHFIVMNGPAGVYELDDFSHGTRAILETVANCDAFSLLGGGHTISAIERFSLDKSHFGYVSLSGKALIEYLCDGELPGVSALHENELRFPDIKKSG